MLAENQVGWTKQFRIGHIRGFGVFAYTTLQDVRFVIVKFKTCGLYYLLSYCKSEHFGDLRRPSESEAFWPYFIVLFDVRGCQPCMSRFRVMWFVWSCWSPKNLRLCGFFGYIGMGLKYHWGCRPCMSRFRVIWFDWSCWSPKNLRLCGFFDHIEMGLKYHRGCRPCMSRFQVMWFDWSCWSPKNLRLTDFFGHIEMGLKNHWGCRPCMSRFRVMWFVWSC